MICTCFRVAVFSVVAASIFAAARFRMVQHSGTGLSLPRLSWKLAVKTSVVIVSSCCYIVPVSFIRCSETLPESPCWFVVGRQSVPTASDEVLATLS